MREILPESNALSPGKLPTPAQWVESLVPFRPYLKNPEDATLEGRGPETILTDLDQIAVQGFLWGTNNKETRKGIEKFRRLLQNALDYRASFKIVQESDCISCTGPLEMLFPLAPPGAYSRKSANALEDMIAECDRILGKKEPKRYARKKIVEDVLRLWVKYTGRSLQNWAIQPSPYSEDKEAPPYALCRLLLTIIEGKDPGDFRRVYERVVRSPIPPISSVPKPILSTR